MRRLIALSCPAQNQSVLPSSSEPRVSAARSLPSPSPCDRAVASHLPMPHPAHGAR